MLYLSLFKKSYKTAKQSKLALIQHILIFLSDKQMVEIDKKNILSENSHSYVKLVQLSLLSRKFRIYTQKNYNLKIEIIVRSSGQKFCLHCIIYNQPVAS